MERYIKEIQKNTQMLDDIAAFSRRKGLSLEEMYVPITLKTVNLESWAREKSRVMRIETAIKTFPHLVILGGPGAGKTTLLKYLALCSCKEYNGAQSQTRVPIPINLREFPAGGATVRDVIQSQFEKFGDTGTGINVEKLLESGQGMILLDGLDELFPVTTRGKVTADIQSFSSKYPHCQIIVSSRPSMFPAYYDESLPPQNDTLRNFNRLEIMGLDFNRVKQFIDNWFGIFSREKSDALLKMVREDKHMGDVAQNPLILSVISGLYEEDNGRLPNRTGLYRRICDVLLCGWDSHKRINTFFAPEKKKFILKKLAFLDHLHKQPVMTEMEILDEIRRHCPHLELKKEETRPLLEEIWQRSGILRKRTTGTYHFLHRSFQEFFTALELNDRENGLDALLSYLADPAWEGPVLFYAGLCKDTGPLINRIQKNSAEDIFYKNLLLLGKCIADAEFVDPTVKEKIVLDLWNLYKSAEFQLLRDNAIAVLSRLNPPGIIRILVDQLTDKEVHIRRSALESLGFLSGMDILPALIMVLVKDKEAAIRSKAAAALGKIGSSEALRPLIAGLALDESGDVRGSAALALGLIGSPEVLPALVKSLEMDKEDSVRGAAAEALGRIGSAGAIAPLLKAFAVEQHVAVRWRIAMALGKLADVANTEIDGAGEYEEVDIRHILIGVLTSDKDGAVRESAAEALGEIGGTETTAALLHALFQDENADVRGSAAYALGFMKSEDVLPALLKTLISDPDGEVRGRAAFALGRIKKTGAIPYLKVVFDTHKESLSRGNAVFALGEIGGVESIPFLIQALTTDKDTYVRFRAAEALGNTGDVMSIPPLKGAMSDEGSYYGWKVKDKAFEALEKVSRRLQVNIFKDETRL